LFDNVSEYVKTAGPLIIFGSFVFIFLTHIIPSNQELENRALERDWRPERLINAKRLFNVTKAILPPLVLLGVCFGLAYSWIDHIWMICTSLGCMSMVGLILFIVIFMNQIHFFQQKRQKEITIEKHMEIDHPNK
jgi:cellobiose-specific phosphotransferase system component IIC